jgi:hypothetical protein
LSDRCLNFSKVWKVGKVGAKIEKPYSRMTFLIPPLLKERGLGGEVGEGVRG